MLQRFNRFSAAVCSSLWQNYTVVIKLTAVTLVVAVLAARQLNINTDLVTLLPENDEVVAAFAEVTKDLGTSDYLLVRLSLRDGTANEVALRAAAEELAPQLQALSQVTNVYGVRNRAQEAELQSFFNDYALLYLTPPELENLLAMLEPSAVSRSLDMNRALLALPVAGSARRVEEDPFHLYRNFNRLLVSLRPVAGRPGQTMLFNRDRSALLLVIKPSHPAQDLDFSRELVTAVRQLPLPSGLAMELGGGYCLALEDSATIKKDISGTLAVSVLLVLGLCAVAFWSGRSLLFIFLPLAIGLVLTAGFCGLALGSLNIVTASFETILVGLGIDFGVHLLSRYRYARERGRDPETAVRETYQHTVPGIVTGAVTTAAAFMVLTASDFRGLRELGLLAGVGIMLCLLTILVLFPALVRILDSGKRTYRQVRFPGSRFLPGLVQGSPRLLVVLAILVTVGFMVSARNVHYNDDPRALRPATSDALTRQQAWAAEFGFRQNYLWVVARGRSEAGLLTAAAGISEQLSALRDAGKITGFRSINTLVPDREQQNRVLSRLTDTNREQLVNQAMTILRSSGYTERFVFSYTERLSKLLHPPGLVDINALLAAGLNDFVTMFVSADRDRTFAHVYLAPERLRSWDALADLRDELAGAGGVVTGMPLVTHELNRVAREEFLSSSIYALLVIVLLLYMHHRSWRLTLFNLVPVLLGIVWLLGILPLIGGELNIVNICVIPLVIGIAVDNGVHLLNHYRESGCSIAALRVLVRPLTLTALTTVAGFGSLLLANYRALAGMGQVAAIGIMGSLLASLVVLPAMLKRKRE